MENIQLSQAQIQLIKVKREKEQLQKKQKQLKKQQELQKRILSEKEQISKDISKDQKQFEAATKFLKQFPSGWYVAEKLNQRKYTVQGQYTNPEDPKSNNYERQILFEQLVDRKSSHITNDKYIIQIREYFTYSSSSWRSHSINNGYKMFLTSPISTYNKNNRAYSSVKTVLQKISQYERTLAYKQTQLENKNIIINDFINSIKQNIKNCTITTGKTYHLKDYVDVIEIVLQNKIKIQYVVNTWNALYRTEITFPEEWSNQDMLNKLNNMK